MNLEKVNLELTEKEGLIYVEMEGKSPDTKFKL